MATRGAVLVVGVLLAACAGGARAPAGPSSSAPAAPGPAGALPPPAAPIALRASYSALSMSQSPIALAQEAGYYAEQGLQVEVLGIRSSAQNATALLSGEIDVSILGGIGPVRARLAGSDLLLIGATKPYFAGASSCGLASARRPTCAAGGWASARRAATPIWRRARRCLGWGSIPTPT